MDARDLARAHRRRRLGHGGGRIWMSLGCGRSGAGEERRTGGRPWRGGGVWGRDRRSSGTKPGWRRSGDGAAARRLRHRRGAALLGGPARPPGEGRGRGTSGRTGARPLGENGVWGGSRGTGRRHSYIGLVTHCLVSRISIRSTPCEFNSVQTLESFHGGFPGYFYIKTKQIKFYFLIISM